MGREAQRVCIYLEEVQEFLEQEGYAVLSLLGRLSFFGRFLLCINDAKYEVLQH